MGRSTGVNHTEPLRIKGKGLKKKINYKKKTKESRMDSRQGGIRKKKPRAKERNAQDGRVRKATTVLHGTKRRERRKKTSNQSGQKIKIE